MAVLMQQPFHFVLGLHNILLKQSEDAEKKQQEMQERYSSSSGSQHKPAMPRMPSSVSFKTPQGGTQMRFN